MTPKVTLSFESVQSIFVSTLITTLMAVFTGCGQSPSFVAQTSEQAATTSSGDAVETTSSGEQIAPDENSVDDSGKNETVQPGSGDSEVKTPPLGDDAEEGRFTSEIKTNDGQTVAIDSFLLSESFSVRNTIKNSNNPLKEHAHVQDLGTPRTSLKSILARTLQTKTFQKTAPLRTEQPHDVTHVGKPLDLFVTVDDSESFTAASIERTRSAVHKLVEDIFATDWRIFLGGLEGVSGNFDKVSISKGSQTLVQAKAAIDNALDSIFAEGSNGDERVIRSLNRLAYDYRNNDRDNAIHAYLIISDAPNCKDRNNSESSACNRVAGQNDHHSYLQTNNTNVSAHIRKNMQLVAAYYRQSSNFAVCGNADDIELPAGGENLKQNSQYAELSFVSERSIDPTIATSAAPKWVGDLCSTVESLTWMTNFTDAVKSAVALRLVLSQAPDSFVAPDTAYNLALHQPLGMVLAPSVMTVKDTYVAVLNPALSGTVTAVFHKQNNYRRTNYENLLSPIPENGTVRITWPGGAVYDCEPASSFASLDSSVKCRHVNDDLHLRNTDFLPTLTPGQAPVTISVQYYNHIEPVTVLELTSADPIFTDTVGFDSVPAGVNPSAATLSTTNGGKTVRLTFPSALPHGDYILSFMDQAQTRQTVPLPTPVATGALPFICYLPGNGVAASINSAGDLEVSPPSAQYPCTLTGSTNTIRYEGRVPKDEKGKRSMAVAYKGFVSPISVFPLEYPPYENKVDVAVAPLNAPDDKVVLDPDSYAVESNQVILDQPLQPGEEVTFDYLFLPPLRECYLLAGKVWKDHKYHVWYGPPGAEERLDSALYTIEKREKGETVCLSSEVPDYGMRLVVGYIAHEKPRPDID